MRITLNVASPTSTWDTEQLTIRVLLHKPILTGLDLTLSPPLLPPSWLSSTTMESLE